LPKHQVGSGIGIPGGTSEETEKMRRKMKLRVATIILLLLSVVLAGCFLFRLPADYAYSLCTSINGMVADSVTRQPLSGVSVEVYKYKFVECLDSTDNTGVYECDKIELYISSTPKRMRELEAKPPLRQERRLRIVFEKPGYRAFELLVPVEFVYCSSHPQPVAIPEVKIPDVFLVRE
jgi:hypothetical protein